jgi:hypothetical protein
MEFWQNFARNSPCNLLCTGSTELPGGLQMKPKRKPEVPGLHQYLYDTTNDLSVQANRQELANKNCFHLLAAPTCLETQCRPSVLASSSCTLNHDTNATLFVALDQPKKSLRAAATGRQHGWKSRSKGKPNLLRPGFGLLNNRTKLKISVAKHQQNMLQRQAASVKGMGGGMICSTFRQRALRARTCTDA